MHDRVIVDNMSEFEHSSSRASCTFSMQDSRDKRGSNKRHKTKQAHLPADSGLHNCILTFPECQSDHHGSCASTAGFRQSVCPQYHPRASLGSDWASKICWPIPYSASVSSQNILLLLLHCACFAHCSCFAAVMMSSASNLSTVP